MGDNVQTAPKVELLLLGREQLAEALSISTATLDRLDAAGKLPKAVPLCRGRKLWRRTEVDSWLAAGCPSREVWSAMSTRNGYSK